MGFRSRKTRNGVTTSFNWNKGGGLRTTISTGNKGFRSSFSNKKGKVKQTMTWNLGDGMRYTTTKTISGIEKKIISHSKKSSSSLYFAYIIFLLFIILLAAVSQTYQ
jgi:hypothetical protein